MNIDFSNLSSCEGIVPKTIREKKRKYPLITCHLYIFLIMKIFKNDTEYPKIKKNCAPTVPTLMSANSVPKVIFLQVPEFSG